LTALSVYAPAGRFANAKTPRLSVITLWPTELADPLPVRLTRAPRTGRPESVDTSVPAITPVPVAAGVAASRAGVCRAATTAVDITTAKVAIACAPARVSHPKAMVI